MNDDLSQMRLQRFLARCGAGSRRSCESLITDGRVCVNGSIVTELGTKVDPSVDTVALDGRMLSIPEQNHTFKLYKPKGYLTSMYDPRGRRCVSDLVPISAFPSLYPIGRLDKDTSGLLLFSTDGDLGHSLMHPSKHIDKTYIATIRSRIDDRELDPLREGIVLDDGRCAPASCRILKENGSATDVSITIHEGKNRQVRRMFKAIGHEVAELKRIKVGAIELDGLKVGQCEELSEEEYGSLIRAISSD